MTRWRIRSLGAAIFLLAIGAPALLVPAAAPQPAGAQQFQPVQLAPPPPGLARVWFLRQFSPSGNLASLSTPWIYANGVPISTSLPGTIFYRDFAPGTYSFTVDSCGTDVNQFPTVQLAPGAQLEFEVQSLESFTPPDCPPRSTTFYVRAVAPRFLQLYLPQLAYLGPR